MAPTPSRGGLVLAYLAAGLKSFALYFLEIRIKKAPRIPIFGWGGCAGKSRGIFALYFLEMIIENGFEHSETVAVD